MGKTSKNLNIMDLIWWTIVLLSIIYAWKSFVDWKPLYDMRNQLKGQVVELELEKERLRKRISTLNDLGELEAWLRSEKKMIRFDEYILEFDEPKKPEKNHPIRTSKEF